MVVDGLKEAAVCPVPFHHSRDAAEIPSRQVPPLHTTLPRSSAGCPPNPRRRRRKRGHFPPKTLRRRVTAGREESSRLSEDPVTVARYFFESGRSSMLRNQTSAPSDWKRILPRAGFAPAPWLATLLFTTNLMVSPSAKSSITFHSPCGFSYSIFGSRYPATSCQEPWLWR